MQTNWVLISSRPGLVTDGYGMACSGYVKYHRQEGLDTYCQKRMQNSLYRAQYKIHMAFCVSSLFLPYTGLILTSQLTLIVLVAKLAYTK